MIRYCVVALLLAAAGCRPSGPTVVQPSAVPAGEPKVVAPNHPAPEPAREAVRVPVPAPAPALAPHNTAPPPASAYARDLDALERLYREAASAASRTRPGDPRDPAVQATLSRLEVAADSVEQRAMAAFGSGGDPNLYRMQGAAMHYQSAASALDRYLSSGERSCLVEAEAEAAKGRTQREILAGG